MIRCNNCGWFNPDTATLCEMCDEELTGRPVEKNAQEHMDGQEPNPVPATPGRETGRDAPAGKMLTETVRFAVTGAPAHRKDYSATVLDATASLEHLEPVHCPKCRYPVSGYAETCPNCGTSLKKMMEETVLPSSPALTVKEPASEPVEEPAAKPPVQDQFKGTVREIAPVSQSSVGQLRRNPKATVREIPQELISGMDDADDVWRLVPVDSPDSEILVLHPGDIVAIGNRRYKFRK